MGRIDHTHDPMNPPETLSQLKARSQQLKPIMRVGKEGVSSGFLAALNDALEKHRLVKVKFDVWKEQKKVLVPEIAAGTCSRMILFVGNTVTLYR